MTFPGSGKHRQSFRQCRFLNCNANFRFRQIFRKVEVSADFLKLMENYNVISEQRQRRNRWLWVTRTGHFRGGHPFSGCP